MTQNRNSISALRGGIEFVSGPLTGVFIGHVIDRFCNSHPWGLIILFLLGTAAGFLNLYKLITKNQTLPTKTNDTEKEI